MAAQENGICAEDDVLQLPDLPQDLITDHILIKLPIKPLLRFKSVSKLWYSTISSHKFATAHFKLSPFLHPNYPTKFLFIHSGLFYNLFYYDDVDDVQKTDGCYGRNSLAVSFDMLGDKFYLVGSCNGLVCLASFSGHFIIWNPITHQRRKIAGSLSLKSFPIYSAYCGFGYASSIDDYKVVQIIELPDTLEIQVYVISLRSNKWRRIDNELYQHLFSLRMTKNFRLVAGHKYPYSFLTKCGVLVSETLYWIVTRTEDPWRQIVAFNLVAETFDEFPHLDLRSDDDFFICIMGGRLSKFGANIRGDVYISMLERPGEMSHICLSRSLSLTRCKDTVGITRTGKFLNMRGHLGLIDPRSLPMKCTTLVTFKRECKISMTNHVPSLISPSLISGLQEE